MPIRTIALIALSASALFAQQLPLMPWPANISVQPGGVPITTDFSVSLSGSGASDPRVASYVRRIFPRLSLQTGIPIQPHIVRSGENATLTIVVEQKDHRAPQRLGDDESYSLQLSSREARISADHPLGALRGIETFLQLVQQNTSYEGFSSPGFSAAYVAIRDQPRFKWRGVELDVARHFIPVDVVKRTLDGMAAVKLNILHIHLSDDQGFRIESKRYPRLQKLGSDGMYYTQSEIRDVIAYAGNRGIRIVPEFDMPGHAASWLPGYPQLGTHPGPYQIVRGGGIFGTLIDPTKESTYRFLDGFVGEMAKLFPDEYFHIGGDEVDSKEWLQNPRIAAFMRKHHLADGPALQTYFNQRLLKIVAKHHKHMEGWDEVLTPGLPKTVIIQSWRGQESLWQAAREGYEGILSAGYYLDLMYPASEHYAVDPLVLPQEAIDRLQKENKPIPPAPTSEQQNFILGGEAAMWEELATSENLDAKLWPRLAAIAERLWSPQSITDTASMYHRLYVVNHSLEWLGLTQRSTLELMRQRLAGDMPHQPLDLFASVLEPVKGYSRHAERYNILTPFNHLVDSIPPESNAAREFRDAVDRYLALPKNQRAGSEELRKQLVLWRDNIEKVNPILSANSLLSDSSAAAEALSILCDSGISALSYLGPDSKSAPPHWKEQTLSSVDAMSARKGDLLVMIAPGIRKLVEAVSESQQ